MINKITNRTHSSLTNKLTHKNYKLVDTFISNSKQKQLNFTHRLNKTLKHTPNKTLKKILAHTRYNSTKRQQFEPSSPEFKTIRSQDMSRQNKFTLITRLPSTNSPKIGQSMEQQQQKKTKAIILHRRLTQNEKWDFKIQRWRQRSQKILSLMPPKKVIHFPEPPKQEKIIITRQKVLSLITSLTKSLQFFWNMFNHDIKKLTNYLKQIEGFNKLIKQTLFINQIIPNSNPANPINEIIIQRILEPQIITKHFEVFLNQNQRGAHFIQKDLLLFNNLQYYSLKMQKKAQQLQKQFKQKEYINGLKRGQELKINIKRVNSLDSTKKLNNNKLKSNPPLSKIPSQQNICKFLVHKRVYLPTYQKQQDLKKLEELGVRFNVFQKMKDKVLAVKQSLNYRFGQILKQIANEKVK